MCKCTPAIKSPWCGRGDCQPPPQKPLRPPPETREQRIERCARRLVRRYVQVDGWENEFVAMIAVPRARESATRRLWFELRDALAETGP